MNNMLVPQKDLSSLPPRPAVSPKRRFVKLVRKSSDGSEQSASSTGSSSTNRSTEGVVIRQPCKNRARRQTNRFSGVFQRGPASSSTSMSLTAGLRSSLSVQTRKDGGSCADALVADDPFELSNQITAPGILKIFGTEICEGAHYKSVLATTHSSAKELVKEALDRYGLNKEEAESYVLCDTIGSIGEQKWKTEGFRVVGDNEKPLLLQSLWKPREGLARRFEIQRRSSVEEKTSRDEDTVTAGLNAQARKLQKSRSRVNSTLIDRATGQNHKLWRSKSEMELLESEAGAKQQDTEPCVKDQGQGPTRTLLQEPNQEPDHIQSLQVPPEGSQMATENLCPPRPRGEQEGEESEREETESSDDNTTQYSIHPPHDCPYLLLLQGCRPTQDFVISLLAGTKTLIGRHSDQDEGTKPDILLFATDILPDHCSFHRPDAAGPTVICPHPDAVVTRNGETLKQEVQLGPGDVIGLGQTYLFLFKDPLALMHKEMENTAPYGPDSMTHTWTLDGCTTTEPTSIEANFCSTCADLQDLRRKQTRARRRPPPPPFLKTPEGHPLTLDYQTEVEGDLLREVVSAGGVRLDDRPPLTAGFLLCVCIQSSAVRLHKSDLRRLLLLVASGVQSTVWEHTKDLSAAQPEEFIGCDSADLKPLTLLDLISGLRPLVVWMSNTLELLQFIQYQLPLILDWRSRKDPGWMEEKDEEGGDRPETREAETLDMSEDPLSSIHSARDETMAVLEEVIMLAFQQCVYYITKFLYPILPGLLDCNPFRKSSDHQVTTGEYSRIFSNNGLQVPGEVQQVVELLNEAWILLSDCQLHPDISSQLIGYLFYFVNASLINSLMERGSEPGFYQWSRGVRMRAGLDLILDWAHAAGQGETALEQMHTLSAAVNLLATPRKNLLKTPWKTLRSLHPALSPAQLYHLLSFYSPASPCRHTWTPSGQDEAAAKRTADILESFDTHHPLVLPAGGYQFQLRRAVTDPALREELDKLQEFITSLHKTPSDAEEPQEPTCHGDTSCLEQSTESRPSNQNLGLPSPASAAVPPSPPSPHSPPSTHPEDGFSSCGAFLLSQKLRHLELQIRDTMSCEEIRRKSALDASCLLTPPNTPRNVDAADVVKNRGDKEVKAESETLSWTSEVEEEGGLVFECLSALKADRPKPESPSMNRILEIKEEEEEQQQEQQQENHNDDNTEEVFSLELERGEKGLGLSLVDTRDTSFRVKGIFVHSVVPGSPAARCKKLVPGDRILAVNGLSLLSLDFNSGKKLIQSSGDRLRLLVARCDWMAKALETGC